jgi:hypothetical protein
MAKIEQTPLISFRSNVFGDNVVVKVFEDRVQFGKPPPKMSTGQRAALGAATVGASVIFTGLGKKDSDSTIIPLEIIDSVETVARGAKDKAKHLSNAGVFPGRGNWRSSFLVLTFSGHTVEIHVDSNEAESIRVLISDLAASRRQQLRGSEQNFSSGSERYRESRSSGIADEIMKLHDLQRMGALTEDEFNLQKSKLLGT